jgi:hypothetical protein
VRDLLNFINHRQSKIQSQTIQLDKLKNNPVNPETILQSWQITLVDLDPDITKLAQTHPLLLKLNK